MCRVEAAKGRVLSDLNAVLADTFAQLAGAPDDPASPWRAPALATNAADGSPGIRTIVLRGFDPHGRVATLHTDARSPKMNMLRANPLAALHIWDAGRRQQIRLDGTVTIAGVADTDAAWAVLPDRSRATYRLRLAPGTPIAAPEDAVPDPSPDAGRGVFAVLRFDVMALEVLSLAHGSHRRAAFHWHDGRLTATWLVP
jgi:pyridoxamine 5'-phosphate oxidase